MTLIRISLLVAVFFSLLTETKAQSTGTRGGLVSTTPLEQSHRRLTNSTSLQPQDDPSTKKSKKESSSESKRQSKMESKKSSSSEKDTWGKDQLTSPTWEGLRPSKKSEKRSYSWSSKSASKPNKKPEIKWSEKFETKRSKKSDTGSTKKSVSKSESTSSSSSQSKSESKKSSTMDYFLIAGVCSNNDDVTCITKVDDNIETECCDSSDPPHTQQWRIEHSDDYKGFFTLKNRANGKCLLVVDDCDEIEFGNCKSQRALFFDDGHGASLSSFYCPLNGYGNRSIDIEGCGGDDADVDLADPGEGDFQTFLPVEKDKADTITASCP